MKTDRDISGGASLGVASFERPPQSHKGFRCRWLGRHNFRYVGMRWREDFPGCKSGCDHECSRCGKTAYMGSRAA